MKKYNVLLVTNGFPYGDSERAFLLEEFSRLQEKFNVTVIAYTQENSRKYSFNWDLDVYRDYWKRTNKNIIKSLFTKDVICEIKAGYISKGIKKHIERTKRIIGYNAYAIYCEELLQDMIDRYNINLIYTYWCTYATLAAVRLKKKNMGLKVISRFHGYDLYNHREYCNWQPFHKEIAARADKLYFVCKRGREYFCRNWCDADDWEKCMVAYLGTKSRKNIIGHNKRILSLVSCSNVIPLKRIHLIVEALSLVPEKYYINWTHIGDGELMKEIKIMTKNLLGRKNNIKWNFTGKIPNEEIEKIYMKVYADLFITTSSSEGGAGLNCGSSFYGSSGYWDRCWRNTRFNNNRREQAEWLSA